MKPREPFQRMTDADIAKAYRDKLGGNPFGIVPEEPQKPLEFCMVNAKCVRVYDPNTHSTSGQCLGYCGYG